MNTRYYWRIVRKRDGNPAGKALHNRTSPIRNAGFQWQRVRVVSPR